MLNTNLLLCGNLQQVVFLDNLLKLEEIHWLDAGLGVLNMVQLSQDMQQAVKSKNPFTALELSVELLEGTCIVQFAVEKI